MHRVRRVPGQEAGVGAVVPDHLTGLVPDNRVPRINKPALGGLEISGVPERQPRPVSHPAPSLPSHDPAIPDPRGQTLPPAAQYSSPGPGSSHKEMKRGTISDGFTESVPEGTRILGWPRSGDGPLSVRARPSSLKHDRDRRATSTGESARRTYTRRHA